MKVKKNQLQTKVNVTKVDSQDKNHNFKGHQSRQFQNCNFKPKGRNFMPKDKDPKGKPKLNQPKGTN